MTKTERVDSTLRWGFRIVGLAVLGIIALVVLSFIVVAIVVALKH